MKLRAPIEKAIQDFSGNAFAHLRSKLRQACREGRCVMPLRHQMALSPEDLAKLQAVEDARLQGTT